MLGGGGHVFKYGNTIKELLSYILILFEQYDLVGLDEQLIL
jgi:hypothetical protein